MIFIFSFSVIVSAEIKEIEIGIDGFSCPFCVFGLKQQMEKIKAIDELKVSLKKSTAPESISDFDTKLPPSLLEKRPFLRPHMRP